ncbi:MAG TPA: hypothetical protein VH482_15045, partial [Thermomicrobiales bacterium]
MWLAHVIVVAVECHFDDMELETVAADEFDVAAGLAEADTAVGRQGARVVPKYLEAHRVELVGLERF